MTTDVAQWEPSTAAAVIDQLAIARDWLRTEANDIDEVAGVLAQADAIALLVRKRELGHDAELAAAEIVRRCERRLEELLIEGQDAGRVGRRGDNAHTLARPQDVSLGNKLRHSDILPSSKLRVQAKVMASANDDDFDDALRAARDEGDMSRTNIVRKLKGETQPAARNEWHRKRRHIDPARVVRESVAVLQGVATGLALIDAADVADVNRAQWAADMRDAVQAIDKFRKELAK